MNSQKQLSFPPNGLETQQCTFFLLFCGVSFQEGHFQKYFCVVS